MTSVYVIQSDYDSEIEGVFTTKKAAEKHLASKGYKYKAQKGRYYVSSRTDITEQLNYNDYFHIEKHILQKNRRT